MDPKEARRNDSYAQLALAATHHALRRFKVKSRDELIPDRTGVIVGSGIGGMETIEKQMTTLLKRGPRRVSPFMIPSLIANIAGGIIAIDLVQRDQITRLLVLVHPVPMPLVKLLK